MNVVSPPKPHRPPARLIEEEDEDVFESTRSSGVGQYGSREWNIYFLFVILQICVFILTAVIEKSRRQIFKTTKCAIYTSNC